MVGGRLGLNVGPTAGMGILKSTGGDENGEEDAASPEANDGSQSL